MARPGRLTVPWFSVDVEPTPAGARDAAARLDDFAARHRVGIGARHEIEAMTVDVVEALGGESARATVEADIDQGTVQVVVTQERPSPVAVDAALRGLRAIGDHSERFDVRRAGAAVEVWICLPIRDDAS